MTVRVLLGAADGFCRRRCPHVQGGGHETRVDCSRQKPSYGVLRLATARFGVGGAPTRMTASASVMKASVGPSRRAGLWSGVVGAVAARGCVVLVAGRWCRCVAGKALAHLRRGGGRWFGRSRRIANVEVLRRVRRRRGEVDKDPALCRALQQASAVAQRRWVGSLTAGRDIERRPDKGDRAS